VRYYSTVLEIMLLAGAMSSASGAVTVPQSHHLTIIMSESDAEKQCKLVLDRRLRQLVAQGFNTINKLSKTDLPGTYARCMAAKTNKHSLNP
jgi:hypothetical protein